MVFIIPVKLLKDFKIFSEELVDLKAEYKPFKTAASKTLKGKQIIGKKIAQIAGVDDISNPLIVRATKKINGVDYRKTDRFTKDLFDKICTGFDTVIKDASENNKKDYRKKIEDYEAWKQKMSAIFSDQERLQKEYKEHDQEPISKKPEKKQSSTRNSQSSSTTQEDNRLLQFTNSTWHCLELDLTNNPITEIKFPPIKNGSTLVLKINDEEEIGSYLFTEEYLLSIILNSNKTKYTRFDIIVDNSLTNKSICVGYKLSIDKTNNILSNKRVLFKKENISLGVGNDYKLVFEFYLGNFSAINTFPLHPIVFDKLSLKNSLRKREKKSKFPFIVGDYFIYFENKAKNEIFIESLCIDQKLDGELLVYYTAKRRPLRSEPSKYLGTLHENWTYLSAELTDFPVVSTFISMPIYLFIQAINNQSLDFITGTIVDPSLSEHHMSLMIAIREDCEGTEEEKLNIATKFLNTFTINDKIKLNKYHIDSLKQILNI